ncbi:MAG TPA: hypothetical protein VG898_09425 [Solirubrobacterales bacterium]|nr:hypothetical protein [Solirubrobacterales bacterium]
MKRIRQRLTYANVMSSIAVFLVLGGASAYAAKKVGSNEIKGNSITTGKVKREAITRGKIKKAAINSSRLAESAVTTPKIANDAVTGDKVKESTLGEVPKASLAVTAESAQPEAFGQINANGSIEAVNSKNIVKAERIGEGEYCVTANFSPRGGQVTPIYDGTGGTTAQLNLNTVDCPAPAVRVFTYSSGATKGDLPFFIHLYH